ncbi:MAG: hypothetical protein JWQ63_987 [Mucilaginibacter sp.]|jgi:hypothetical protein|nr:hypothetical protein [Mucilaginibacter sp.]
MHNPTRRNRNIGTSKQGHGKSNKLTIPSPCVVSKTFFERLGPYEKVEKLINGHSFIFVTESTRQSSKHACSISDIERIIENIPLTHYGSLRLIVLRQPKRKEEIVSPVWGRLIYSYEFEDNYYPAIILEAVDYNKKLHFKKSQSPDDQKEFERLKKDGHQFVENKNIFTSSYGIEKVRNTQLYRTLLHEFGHYVQYLEVVEMPGKTDEDFEDWDKRFEVYLKIPKSAKEKYAHKYADDLLEKLQNEKLVPFDAIQ